MGEAEQVALGRPKIKVCKLLDCSGSTMIAWLIVNAFLTQSAFSQSAPPPDAGDARYFWKEHVTSSYSEATLTGRSEGNTTSVTRRNSAFQFVPNAARSLLQTRDSLQSTLRPLVARQVSSVNGAVMRNWYFRASGPISIQLTARGGAIEASVGGFSINTSFKVKQADLIYGKVNIRTNTIWLDGIYEPWSGRIRGLSLSPSVDIYIDVDADGLLGIVSTFLELGFRFDVEELVERKLRDGFYSALNSLGSQERMVFGLNRLLALDDFSRLGVDLEQGFLEVMQMLEGRSVTIRTTESYRTLRGTGIWRCGRSDWYQGAPKRRYLVGVSVTTSSGYSLSVREAIDTELRYTWLGTCGSGHYN